MGIRFEKKRIKTTMDFYDVRDGQDKKRGAGKATKNHSTIIE
jgi:hypothetical protein